MPLMANGTVVFQWAVVREADEEVGALVDAWPQLSPDVRRSILAIVQASLGEG